MTRVGIVGGHCQLIEALRGSIRRAESRGIPAPGCMMFLKLIQQKNETQGEIIHKGRAPAAGGRR